MSTEEWINRLRKIPQAIRDTGVLYHATTTTMVQVSERIWGKGELTNGSKLTYTNAYEVYAYKPPSPVKPSGKGKYGAKIKGGWYPNYSAYKAGQNRPDSPFELTGDLRFAWFGGQVANPKVVDALNCRIVLDEKNAKKAEGLTKEKGAFLPFNDKEKQAHAENIARELNERVYRRA